MARGLNFIIQVTIWSNLFPPDVYGQIAYCYVFISFMTVILPFGFDAAFMNYYVRKNKKSAYLTNTIAFIMLVGLLFVALIFIFRNQLSMIAVRSNTPHLLTLSLAILFFDMLNNQGVLLLRADNRAGLSVLLLNIEIIVRLVLLLLLISGFSQQIEYILWANVGSSVVLFIALAIIMMPQLRISLFSGKIMKELLFFGFPFMISGLFDRTIELADRRLLGYYAGDETVGLYVACYTIAALIRLVIYGFNAGWHPYFLREIDQPEGRKKIERINFQTGTIFIALWFLASLWIPYLVRIPLGQERTVLHSAYWTGLPIIPVIMGAYVMMGIYFLQLPGIYYRKKTGMIAVFMGVGAAVNIILNLILIPRMGMMGAAIATALAYTCMAGSIWLWNRRFFPIMQGSGKLLIIICVSVGLYIIVQAVNINIFLKIVVSVLYFGGMYIIQPIRLSSLLRK